MELFLLNMLNGISFGAILFLVGAGLSLIWGVMGILNLAHGALYMVGAYIGWTIAIKLGWNFWLAVLAGAVVAGLLGLVMERGFFRYLRGRLNEQVLLTFGVLYILTNLCQWIWGPVIKAPFTAPILSGSFHIIGGYTYSTARIAISLIGIAVAIGLWWLIERTRIGAIIRAGMDDRETTMGLGINHGLFAAAIFVLGCFLVGGTGVIGAHLFGVYLDLGLDILLLAIVVTVVGGTGSVRGALLGAMLIGLIISFGKALVPQLSMFFIYLAMIIILLVKPSGLLGRAVSSGGASSGAEIPKKVTARVKPIKQPWQEKIIRYSPFVIGGIIFIILPSIVPSYIQSILTEVIIFAIFAMSLDILMGYTGLVSLGHAAFFGVGGYTVGILLTKHYAESFWIIAPAGILMAAIAAAVFGIIALRTSGVYFMLVTLALSMLLYSLAFKWFSVTRGSDGLAGIKLPALGLPWLTMNHTSFYYFIFLASIICFFLMYRLVNSPFGYALQGIRENEPRMQSLGYNTWLYKYIAFIIAGLFAGVAGTLFAYNNGVITPVEIGATISILAVLICIIGGLGTLWGPVIGAVVIILVEYFSSIYFPERWPLVLGAVFVVTVMFLRGGIAPYLLKFWERVSYGSTKS